MSVSAGAGATVTPFEELAQARERHRAARGVAPQVCDLRLGRAPDPLTRLMMDADGVSETELAALVRRVAAARARHV